MELQIEGTAWKVFIALHPHWVLPLMRHLVRAVCFSPIPSPTSSTATLSHAEIRLVIEATWLVKEAAEVTAISVPLPSSQGILRVPGPKGPQGAGPQKKLGRRLQARAGVANL